MAEIQRLAKTGNFKQYLELAICNQFVCGLQDSKCLKELLCVVELTADLALQWAKQFAKRWKSCRNPTRRRKTVQHTEITQSS